MFNGHTPVKQTSMNGLLIKKSKVGFLFSFLLISQILNCDKLSAQELKKSKDYKEIEIKGTVLISTGNLVPFASITLRGNQ